MGHYSTAPNAGDSPQPPVPLHSFTMNATSVTQHHSAPTVHETESKQLTARSVWYQQLNFLNCLILFGTPLAGGIGVAFVPLSRSTAAFSVFYYFLTCIGVTAGYHRLWSHRSYNARRPLEYALAIFGAGAVQGSIQWWCRKHRAHHRYTDTDLDPYNVHHGLFWAHFGWMIFKPKCKSGAADVSDLRGNAVIQWQHNNYLWLVLVTAYLTPAVICGVGWRDWWGGLIYAGFVRSVLVHHSTFCVNSLAHYLGESTFDDKHSPRDHVITALLTQGEGYHNFHHQFPSDYRNAIHWYQYDPTKWFIGACQLLGLASHLRTFPNNEIQKGVFSMELKRLRSTQDSLKWPVDNSNLPVISWKDFQLQAENHPLILISGFIHDVSTFLDQHPGGRKLLEQYIGRDSTAAFFGGVYEHSNAAHNLLAMKRVGVLHGGAPHVLDLHAVPPSQRLKIIAYGELRI
ncbi:delta9-fatty acid desaturase [Mycena rebaudengoi]|nr:delta9-fatty acid desaturase [Mycena rebaudengoi]